MSFYISRFKDIEKREFEVEVVTPLFLGGSNPQKAEVRAAPIKGSIRFWWRAIFGHLTLDKLKQNEAIEFGDSGKIGKSNLNIKIGDFDHLPRERYSPVPHKQVPFKFEGFKPGEKFVIKIYSPPKHMEIFKIATILGGFGKRSRRGFGSINIIKINGSEYNFSSTINDIFKLLDSIEPGVFKIENNCICRAISASSISNYPYIKEIMIGQKTYTDYNSVLKIIGQSSHDNKSDYTGYAGRGNERFSSPIYVSVNKAQQNIYLPIITTLNTAFQDNRNHGPDKSLNFKKQILNGGAR